MNNDEHRRCNPPQKSNQYSQYISKLYLKLPTPRLPFASKSQFPWKSSTVGKIPIGGFNMLQPGWPGSLPKPSHCCQDSLPSSNSMVSRFISRSISSHTLPTTGGLSFLSYWTWMNLVFLGQPEVFSSIISISPINQRYRRPPDTNFHLPSPGHFWW